MDSINIPAEALNGLVAKAIFDSIGPEQRDALVTSAITKLIQPQKVPYGREEASVLQQSFDGAVQIACRRVVMDLLENDENLKTQIRGIASERLRDLVERRDELKAVIVEAVTEFVIEKSWS